MGLNLVRERVRHMINKIEERIKSDWESAYSESDIKSLPWEAWKPPERLVKFVESGKIKTGKAIDLGCGLGTNSIYLAGEA